MLALLTANHVQCAGFKTMIDIELFSPSFILQQFCHSSHVLIKFGIETIQNVVILNSGIEQLSMVFPAFTYVAKKNTIPSLTFYNIVYYIPPIVNRPSPPTTNSTILYIFPLSIACGDAITASISLSV